MKNLATIQTSFLQTGNSTGRFRIVCLIPVISLLLLYCSCTPARFSTLKKTGDSSVSLAGFVPVGTGNKKVLYKAGIDLYGHHFSGMILIKYLGERHYRTVFVTEVGMSVFDFEFNRGDFKDCGSVDFIKRPYIMETLKRDLMLILMEGNNSPRAVIYDDTENGGKVYRLDSGDGYNYYFMDKPGNLLRIENPSGNFKKIEIEYFYDSKQSIRKMVARHYNIDLMMEFNILENSTGNE